MSLVNLCLLFKISIFIIHPPLVLIFLDISFLFSFRLSALLVFLFLQFFKFYPYFFFTNFIITLF